MILTLALAAAAPVVTYRARGQEPGWMLEVERRDGGGEVARFVFDYGKGKATEALSPPLAGRNGVRRWRSVSGRMTVGLSPRPCEDAMSGEQFPMTAFVTWQGKTYRGCGGPAVVATTTAAIENAEWIVEEIGGRGIIDNAHVTIEIRKNGVSGRSGCNRYFGSVELDRERVKFGQMGSTRMACAPALMAQEQAFLAVLGAVQRWRIDTTGALVMTAADGRTLRARKA